MQKIILTQTLLLILPVSWYGRQSGIIQKGIPDRKNYPCNPKKKRQMAPISQILAKMPFGTLELNYKTVKYETLIICLGEKLLNGNIDSNPGGSIRYAEVELPVTPSQTKIHSSATCQ